MHTDKLPFMWRHKKTFAREFSLTNVDHGAAEYISTIRRRRGTCQALLGKFSFRPGTRTGTFREKRTQSARQPQARAAPPTTLYRYSSLSPLRSSPPL